MTTERRRARAAAAGGALVVPPRFRRFVLAEWLQPGVDTWSQRAGEARAAWTAARRRWAVDNGFDVEAPYGTRPGADWWAFVALCQQQNEEGER